MQVLSSHSLTPEQQAQHIEDQWELSKEEREEQISKLAVKKVITDQRAYSGEYMSQETYTIFIKRRLQSFLPEFRFDKDLEDLFYKLSLYYWGNPKFELEGYGSLQKGIFLAGNVGVGKTTLMKAFRPRPETFGNLVNTNDVCDDYQSRGIEYLITQYGIKANLRPSSINITFDDLGAERIPISHMGNPMNVMERIILNRYEVKAAHRYTHFTSNLDSEGIEQLYGTRVVSRMAEMVNFFVLPGSDRRK